MKPSLLVGLLRSTALVLFLFLPFAYARATTHNSATDVTLIAEGRHLVVLGGCNYCHTAGWASSDGEVSEKDWLEGTPIGRYGPWGTTYPINLRLFIPSLPEDGWVKFAHVFRANPPMPWFDVNHFTDRELKAIYDFVKYLGPAGKPAPADLPPGEKPKPPYVNMNMIGVTHTPQHPKPRRH